MQKLKKYFVLGLTLLVLSIVGTEAQAQSPGHAGGHWAACTDSPGCCAYDERQHRTCSNGTDGEEVYSRTVRGPGCGGSTGWSLVYSTCESCAESTQYQDVACPTGFTGTNRQARRINIGGTCGNNQAWVDFDNRCVENPVVTPDQCGPGETPDGTNCIRRYDQAGSSGSELNCDARQGGGPTYCMYGHSSGGIDAGISYTSDYFCRLRGYTNAVPNSWIGVVGSRCESCWYLNATSNASGCSGGAANQLGVCAKAAKNCTGCGRMLGVTCTRPATTPRSPVNSNMP